MTSSKKPTKKSRARSGADKWIDPRNRPFTATYKHDWKPVFIDALRDTRNFTQACKIANISRGAANKQKDKDPEFAKAIEEAWEYNVDQLEASAMKRATEGWLEPVFHQGVRVGWVRKFSTGLTIFMLKAWRPERYQFIDGQADKTPAEKAKLIREALEAMGGTIEHDLDPADAEQDDKKGRN